MKKLSKMQKQMRETIGIDLGDKVSRYCIVDPDGEVVEEGNFRNQASSIEKHFGDRPRRIALEAGAQSAWISREFEAAGARSHRGQPTRVEVDHRERHQERSGRCAQAGAAGARRRAAAASGGTSHGRAASRTGRHSGARCDPAGAHAVDQQCARHRQRVRRAPAQVDHGARSANGPSTALPRVSAHRARRIAGTDRRLEPADRRLRSTDRRVGRGTIRNSRGWKAFRAWAGSPR